ncbi:MAG: hypothetical protein COB67_03980 [SAR324 cluster bacterium]|uniref:N-acetyltransferase domain-containing protein n=1 Tax=SAR324 cluster bacterium TaxID=2024889 RepID=A0A2A4T819_9DELT|nr:MAG: hypothetical protein COB67_03980 [SAR324 cluster bacterium]
MSQSIEVQMLNALEIFHYSYRFRDHLFILALEDESRLQELITDLRVLLSSRIQVLLLCRDHGELQGVLETWSQRGYPFQYFQAGLEFGVSKIQKEAMNSCFQAGIIPVLGVSEDSVDTSLPFLFDRFAMNLAQSFMADKLFFISTAPGLIVDGRFLSHLTPQEIDRLLETAKDINIGRDRLHLLATKNQDSVFETVLIEGTAGSLYQEIFTHRGKGTLLTSDYPNLVRQGKTSDIMDLLLMMKPYIHSQSILPVSEDELAQTVESYFVYSVNNSIVATARIIDFGEACELAKFCTMPRYQGRGRARQLALSMIESVKAMGKDFVFALSVEPKMWLFFQSLGFEEHGRERLPEPWKKQYDFSRPSKAFYMKL